MDPQINLQIMLYSSLSIFEISMINLKAQFLINYIIYVL